MNSIERPINFKNKNDKIPVSLAIAQAAKKQVGNIVALEETLYSDNGLGSGKVKTRRQMKVTR